MSRSSVVFVKELSRSQVSRFVLVGGLSFLIEYVLFIILVDVAGIKYTQANLPAMTVAIICNYFLTKWFVFQPKRHNGKITFVLFTLFTLMGVVLNQFMLWFMVEQIAVDVKVSKVLAVSTVAIFNYFTKKHFVF
ncbi:GtrA family protein [Pedobacter sp. SYSU D00535]|uniref:GtrA family protein n=1 Tax=Pedobacter sp. SYSU D00535 TaxID=2810308 RepID=UPI001A974810|nr:GtrA family protein [Pedobacter sp. SYSU D00535]